MRQKLPYRTIGRTIMDDEPFDYQQQQEQDQQQQEHQDTIKLKKLRDAQGIAHDINTTGEIQ